MKKIYILLFFILLLACLLRFFQLGKIPDGFHADEAAFGYNSYSILKTGKDEYSHFLPLTLKSFGDYKGAIYSYLTIPSIAIFGVSEFAVRLPTAIFGMFFVIITFLITDKITKNKTFALISSALVSISPIMIFLSRVQSDPLVAVFFILLGFYCFLIWIENNNMLYLFLNLFLWIISFFTYASPKIFVPLFIFLILAFYFKKIKTQKRILLMIFYGVTIVISISLLAGNSGQRFNQLTVFNSASVNLPLEEKIREDRNTPLFLTRIFHNKVIDYANYAINNYFSYINYSFLFSNSGQPMRERMPNAGLFYLVELPFFLLGLYLIFHRKLFWGYFTTIWFFAVPALLIFAVDETPNIHRFLFAVYPFELIVSFGVVSFIQFFKKNKNIQLLLTGGLVVIFGINLIFYMHELFIHQPIHQPWFRGYIYKPFVAELNKNYANYKKIVITKANSSPYIYILFFDKYDPVKYQLAGSPRDLDYKGFDKYYFVPDDCPLKMNKLKNNIVEGEPNVLYVNNGDCDIPKTNSKLISKIKWRDGAAGFTLLEYIPSQSAQMENRL